MTFKEWNSLITDMTKGNPVPMLWKFSIPILLSSMFQQLYNIADSAIAGRFVGENALAAVGSSYPITMIFMAIAFGANIGTSVVISRLFGAKEYDDMKSAVNTSFISIVVLSVFLTVFGLVFCNAMMVGINTPQNVFDDAALYLRVYISGLVFLFLYNISTGIFTALGDSKTPLYFLIASSVGNILIDILFVVIFKMGVAGVAWATFVTQSIAAVLSVTTLMIRLKKIKCTCVKLFDFHLFKTITRIAIPSILQQSFISVGNLLIQGLVNSMGSAVMAGYSAAVKLNTFCITSFTSFANGISSYTAQNIGAGEYKRVEKGFKAGVIMIISVALPEIIVMSFFPHFVAKLFMDTSSVDAMKICTMFLKTVSPFYIFIGIKLIADGIIRGSGKMTHFMIATFSDLILRVIISYIMAPSLSFFGIALSWPIGWLVATAISYAFYKKRIWERL